MMSDWIHIENDPRHVAREKIKAGNLRKQQWWQNKISRGVCYYCEGKFLPQQLTMDHIIPLSRGGKSTKGNIVACCKSCNNKKNYLTPAEIALAKLGKPDIADCEN